MDERLPRLALAGFFSLLLPAPVLFVFAAPLLLRDGSVPADAPPLRFLLAFCFSRALLPFQVILSPPFTRRLSALNRSPLRLLTRSRLPISPVLMLVFLLKLLLMLMSLSPQSNP